MKKSWNVGKFIALAAICLPMTVHAQWPSYPTVKVPKTAKGEPDLLAPAPKTPDGKPDFTGLWDYVPLRVPNTTNTSFGLGVPRFPNQFWRIGSEFKDGLPFTPWAATLRDERMAGNNKDNPDAHCLPIGLMQLQTHPQPRKIIQTPAVLVMMYEANGGLRQIFLDGRPLPGNDPQPWWYGYSTGHWEGDTLVVETNGFRDDVWLDVEGSPLTNTGKMTERIRRVNFGNLETQITVEDPKTYTRPWTVTVRHKILLDTDLIEFVCQENEKDVPHLTEK